MVEQGNFPLQLERRNEMLTFEFTGVAGSMTENERLTSGMVGKQVQIILSSDWADLNCTAVFVSGDICRTVQLSGSTVTIPEDNLRYPFRRLLVGVWGTDQDGTLVIPTVMAEGPFVELGANPYGDPVAVTLPVWENLQNQIGNLAALTTEEKDSLVAAINEVKAAVEAFELSPSGPNGGYFTPAVSDKGVLSWTNNMNLKNPAAVNIRGGDGYSIYYVEQTIGTGGLVNIINLKPELIESGGRDVQVGDFLLTSNGCLANVTDANAAGVTADLLMKLKPVRGEDYWTEDDIAEIHAYIDAAIQEKLG